MDKMKIDFVREAFDGVAAVTKKEMTVLLRNCGVLGRRSEIEESPKLSARFLTWELAKDRYDAKQACSDIVDSVTHPNSDEFNRYISKELQRVFACRKRRVVVEEKPVKPKRHVNHERLAELAKPRSQMVPAEEEFEYEPHISRNSKNIIRENKYGKMNMEERLAAQRKERPKNVKTDDGWKKPETLGKIPDYVLESRGAFEEIRRRREEELKQTPSFRPKITSFKEFNEKKEILFKAVEHPKNWDKTLARMKKGRELAEEKKKKDLDLSQT